MQNVVAIPANPALVNSTEDFIHAVENDRKDSAEKFIQMADHLTECIKLRPDWPRGYVRLAESLVCTKAPYIVLS